MTQLLSSQLRGCSNDFSEAHPINTDSLLVDFMFMGFLLLLIIVD
jgi:hypothetical protein